MRLTVPEITIEDDEGFEKNDLFGHKEFGERFASLIANSGGELVVALDADFGQGKTTFIKMWKGYVSHHRPSKMQTLYFDAFANDYQADPFLALVSKIYTLTKDDSEKEKEELRKTIGNATKTLARGVLKTAAKHIAGDAVDEILGENAASETANNAATAFDNMIKNKLESYEKDMKALTAFRDYLKAFSKKKGNGNPIVFIINELDRCRPDFALELLEKIKHLFAVEGFVFILVMNKQQMLLSLKAQYGIADEAKGLIYLTKFINLWVYLPQSTKNNVKGFIIESLSSMCIDEEEIEVKEENGKEKIYLIMRHSATDTSSVKFLIAVSLGYQLSYRDIQKILPYFVLLKNIAKDNDFMDESLIPFIAYMWVFRKEEFDMFLNGGSGHTDFSTRNSFALKLVNKDVSALVTIIGFTLKSYEEQNSQLDDFHKKLNTFGTLQKYPTVHERKIKKLCSLLASLNLDI